MVGWIVTPVDDGPWKGKGVPSTKNSVKGECGRNIEWPDIDVLEPRLRVCPLGSIIPSPVVGSGVSGIGGDCEKDAGEGVAWANGIGTEALACAGELAIDTLLDAVGTFEIGPSVKGGSISVITGTMGCVVVFNSVSSEVRFP